MQKFWMVYVEGSPIGAKVKHATQEAACNEAERIATKEGKQAYVMGVESSVVPVLSWRFPDASVSGGGGGTVTAGIGGPGGGGGGQVAYSQPGGA